jgi:cell shape-determining protein MreD
LVPVVLEVQVQVAPIQEELAGVIPRLVLLLLLAVVVVVGRGMY